MKLHIENRVRAGYIVVFFLLSLSYLSFFIANNQLTEQTDELKSEEVMPEIPRVKTGIKAGPEVDVVPAPTPPK